MDVASPPAAAAVDLSTPLAEESYGRFAERILWLVVSRSNYKELYRYESGRRIEVVRVIIALHIQQICLFSSFIFCLLYIFAGLTNRHAHYDEGRADFKTEEEY